MGGVYTALSTKRGTIICDEPIIGTPLTLVKSYLPVSESFGFTGYLRSCTGGKATPQCYFDHWDLLNQDPLDVNSKANAIV